MTSDYPQQSYGPVQESTEAWQCSVLNYRNIEAWPDKLNITRNPDNITTACLYRR